MLREKHHTGGCLITPAAGHLFIDNATLISGQNLEADTVLGQITASKKWTAYDPNAGDGSQTAKGILYEATDASDADTPCAVIVRDCEVNGNELVYKDLSPALDEAVAAASLALAHIIVRN